MEVVHANKQLRLLTVAGLSCSALILAIIFLNASLCSNLTMPLRYIHHSLPAIKSCCLEYLGIMWTLFIRKQEAPPAPMAPGASQYLFLFLNLIVFLILITLHLQQHAAASAARKARRKRRTSESAERLNVDRISSSQPLQSGRLSLANSEKEEDCAAGAMSSCSATAVMGPQLEASMADGSSDFAISTVAVSAFEDSPSIEGLNGMNDAALSAASMETLPAQYNIATRIAVSADDSEVPSWPGATTEKIVLEEDGRLRLVEVPDISPKPVEGRFRWVDGPHVKAQGSCDTLSGDSTNSDYNRETNNRNCASSNMQYQDSHEDSSSDLAVKECDVSHSHNVPKSVGLDSHDLITCDVHKVTSRHNTFSRAIVKSMDATYDNTLGMKTKSQSNVVKRVFRLRREPSVISQHELNARVESFIASFNEKIKIQRQQSLVSYMQMVDRGA